MARQIFRQAALDRLASPEKLDMPVRLVGAPGWLILAAFAAALGYGAWWAFTTEAPVSVEAEGILIDRAGLVEVAADRGGRLETVSLVPATVVQAGAAVASLSQAELRRDLANAEARFEDAAERYDRFATFYAAQQNREERSDAARRATIERSVGVLRERVVLLEEKAANLAGLVDRQVVIRDKLLDAQIAVTDAYERISVLEEEALRLELDAVERDSERRISLLDEGLKVDEQKREVARLRAQLSDSQVIRSAHTGLVVEVKVNAGDVVQPGDALATLSPLDGSGELEAIFYAPPGEGKRIETGMVAEVAPQAVEREVYGFITAEVASVAPLPATPEGMRRTLQNDQLVSQLAANGAPIEARVTLDRDPLTPTGFAWSSSEGPVHGVGAGALIRGRVIVDYVPVIDLVIPGLSKMLADLGG